MPLKCTKSSPAAAARSVNHSPGGGPSADASVPDGAPTAPESAGGAQLPAAHASARSSSLAPTAVRVKGRRATRIALASARPADTAKP